MLLLQCSCAQTTRLACSIPGRTDQQCMGRWRRHLDPNIRKCSWLPQEDATLKAKYDEQGPQWSSISKFLHGRTAQQCRARWFQLCPADNAPHGPGGQRVGNNRKDRTERFKDSESIQASARLLLTQMDDLGELPLQRPPAAKRGARARLPLERQEMYIDDDSPLAYDGLGARPCRHASVRQLACLFRLLCTDRHVLGFAMSVPRLFSSVS